MTKKERLGSDPFKESPLNWIHDTREEKKDSKELKKQNPKTLKRQNVKDLKRYDVKTSKGLSVKASKQDKIKKPDHKKRHTIYLSSKQSKKLKVYAAGNDMKLSEVVEKLINEKI
jgi:tRNA U34 5-carboxymethylaminomethyl modifying enzyme MnmG/GidA